jgi:hypothetical protein
MDSALAKYAKENRHTPQVCWPPPWSVLARYVPPRLKSHLCRKSSASVVAFKAYMEPVIISTTGMAESAPVSRPASPLSSDVRRQSCDQDIQVLQDGANTGNLGYSPLVYLLVEAMIPMLILLLARPRPGMLRKTCSDESRKLKNEMQALYINHEHSIRI